MKTLFTALLLVLLCSFSAFSQNFIWANGIGAGSTDLGNDIATDSSGNTVLVGSFTGSITLDTITLSTSLSTNTSSFIAKFNPAGDVIWAVDFAESTSTFFQGAAAVSIDKSTGEIYVTGDYGSSFTLGGTTVPYVSPGTDIFLAKFNSQGVAQWVKAFTGDNSDSPTNVVFDPSSNSVYVSGFAIDTLDIDTVQLVATSTGFLPTIQFLAKYSATGQFKWAKEFQTASSGFFIYYENSGGLSMLSNGDVIMTGTYNISITLGSQTLNSGGSFDSDGFLSRIDSSGNVVWAQTIGGTGQDFARDVAVDLNNNIWVTGNVDGTATLDTFTFSGSNSGVFAARLDSAGNANYAYANGISGSNTGNGVGVDELGNAYFVGRYFNSITFGSFTLTGLTTFSIKLFISKYNVSTSSWEWAIGPNYSVGSSSIEEAKAIAVDGQDGVLVTGSFSGAMNLGATTLISSGGSQDIFLTKVGDCSGLSASFSAAGPTTFCTGQSVTFLADTGYLYEYQWLFNGSILPGQINTEYTAIQSGDYTLVIDSLGCLDTATSVTVSLNASPTVALSAFGTYCENAIPFVLTGGLPLGGTYSGPGVSSGVFNPSAAGPGTHPITYTFSNSNGCEDSEFKFVTVTASPFVFMLSQPSVCVNAAPFALTSGIPAGGTYSGTGVLGGMIFSPAVAGIGTHTIYYTRTTGLCSTTDSVNITVNGVPNVNLNPLPNICISTVLAPLVGGTPSGGVYSGTGVSNPFFFPSAVGVGQHDVIYTVTQNGCASSDTATITVDPIPNPIMAQLPVLCENDADLNLVPYAFPTGGVFSGPSVVNTIFSPSIFGVGTDSIVYTITNSCGSDTAVRPITVQAAPTVSVAAISDVCINAGVQSLSGGTPIGGTFSGTGVNGGTFNPIVAGVGTHSITYSFTNANGCTDSASTSITVNPLPTVTLSAFSNICIDAGIQTLSGGLPTGGTYFGTAVTGGVFNPTTAGVGTFQIGYAYANTNGCADTAFRNITVNSLPTVTLSAFAAVCLNAGSQALSGGLPIGGTYFGTGVSGGNFNPATAGVGTHQIGYAFANSNSCADTAYQTITVNPLPTVTLSAFANVCIDAGTFALTGGLPTGGTYFGTGVSGGSFSPAVAGAGTHQIGYAFADSNSCADTAYQNIVVNPLPTVTLSAFAAICIDAGTQTLSGGLPTGGTYFGTAVTGGVFNPTTAGVGTFQIGYAYANANGCSDTAFRNITVNPLPNVTLSAFAAVCLNAGSQALSGGLPSGGTYFGTGVSSGNFNPTTAGVGTHQIGYAYANANGCSDTVYQTITVNPLPTVTLSAFAAICIDAGSLTLTGGLPTGGTYFGTGVSGGSFSPAVAGAGTHQIGYAFADSNSCADTAYQNIVVNPLPTVTLSAFAAICIDAGELSLSGGLPTGGTYFGTAVTGGVFNPTTAGVGTFQIGYAFANANGCADTAFRNITVNPLPTVTLTAFAAVCLNAGSQALSGGLPTGGTYFGTGVSSGNFNPATAGVGTHQIGYAYANANGCADTAYQNIVVNPLPIATLSAFANVCIDAGTFSLTGGLPSGGTYFGTGVSGGSFSPATAGAGTHQIGYAFADSNSCADTAYQNIVVNPLPTVTLSAFAAICIDAGTQTLSGGLPIGGTYFGTAVTGGVFNPTTAGVGTFQIGYAYANANGCSDTAFRNITVNPLPTVTLSAFAAVCLNAGSQALSGGLPSGGTYFGTGVSSGNFNPTTAGVGTHQIGYAYANANGCADTAYQNIVVNPLPIVTLSAFANVCVDAGTFALTGGLPTGGTYFGTGVSGVNFSPIIAGAGTHQIGYAFADSNSCVDTAYQNIVVNSLPTVTLSAFAAICIDAGTQTLSGGLLIGGTYFGTAVSAGNFDPTTSGVGTFQIGYAYAEANSCADTAYQNITVNPLPTVSLSAFADVCLNAGSLTLSGGLPSGGTYFGTGISGGNFSPTTAGVGSHQIGYAYADANGCSDTAYQNITVNPLPTVTLSAFANVCIDAGSFTLTGGLPTGGTYFGTGVSSGIFDPATAGAGTHQIGYAFADSNSCADTAYKNIVVNPLPVVTFTITDTICLSSANLTITSGSPLGGFYSGSGITGNVFSPSVAGSGNHVITYLYTNANGCSAQREDSIYVRPEPIVNLPSIADVCSDLYAFALPTPSPLGGVFSSTGTLIGTDTFDVAASGVGVFDVAYTFTDNNGCVSVETQQFTINALPSVTFDLPIDSVCEYTPVVLVGQSPLGGIFSGPNVSNGTIFTSDLEFSQQITYTFTDANGCANSAADQLWVYPDPGIQFSQEPLQLCAGEVVSLDFANPLNGNFVSPFVNNGVLTAPDSAFNGAGGIYSFGNVCGFDQDTFYLSVTPNPEVDLGNDTLICEGNTLLLDAGLQSGYAWSDFTSEATYLVNGSGSGSIGSQTVSVIVFDALGCTSTDEITIQVAAQPAFYLGDNIYACLDSVIELSVDNVYDSFVWSTGDTGLTIQAHDGSIIMPGIYDFWVKGINATGCSYTDSISLALADCNNEFVGIEEPSAALNELIVYPNPTRANFYVQWNEWQTNPLTEMRMYNMLGSLVKTVSLENTDAELIEISTSALADGVYLLSINTASATRIIRVLIQK